MSTESARSSSRASTAHGVPAATKTPAPRRTGCSSPPTATAPVPSRTNRTSSDAVTSRSPPRPGATKRAFVGGGEEPFARPARCEPEHALREEPAPRRLVEQPPDLDGVGRRLLRRCVALGEAVLHRVNLDDREYATGVSAVDIVRRSYEAF